MAISPKSVCILLLQFGLLQTSAITLKLEDIINENEIDEETILTADDFARAPEEEIDLTLLGIQMKPDPTMGNMTEGDIVLPNFKGFIERNSRLQRSAVRQFYRRWPSGEIPYAISSRYGPYSRSVIAKAMKKFHDVSCIRFIPRLRDQHHDYLYIIPHDGCYSLVGRAGGSQPVSLEADCIQSGTIIHELMHAIGFFHEQSRPDRDEYIEIIWRNVMNGAEDQFDKHSSRYIDLLNEPYDYTSIMHYGPYAFSGNGRRTIIALKRGGEKMGQRKSLSPLDIRKINKLYSCSEKSSSEIIDEIGTEDYVQPTADCTDKSWHCVIWALSIFDYCLSSKETAYELCPESCGTCSYQLTNKTKTAAVKPGIGSKNLELSTNNEINTVKIHHITNSTPKTIPIEISTGISENTATNCRDLDYSCPFMVRIFDCDNFLPQYSMKNICPLSCGFCSDNNNDSNYNNDNNNNNNNNNSNNIKANKTPKVSIKKCEDRGSYLNCKLALFFNECDEKVNLCAKTCGAC